MALKPGLPSPADTKTMNHFQETLFCASLFQKAMFFNLLISSPRKLVKLHHLRSHFEIPRRYFCAVLFQFLIHRTTFLQLILDDFQLVLSTIDFSLNKRSLRSEWGSYLVCYVTTLYFRISRRQLTCLDLPRLD